MSKSTIAKWSLRIGLAFVFIYASVEIFISPDRFLKYVPLFLQQAIPSHLFLPLFGVSEVLLAVWLLCGWKGHIPALLSALMMAGIVAFNMEHFQILFRNVAIGFGSISLVLLELTDSQKRREVSKFVINKLKSKLSVPQKKQKGMPFKIQLAKS